jgi:hypothetical protein
MAAATELRPRQADVQGIRSREATKLLCRTRLAPPTTSAAAESRSRGPDLNSLTADHADGPGDGRHMEARGITTAPWQITTAVSCLPVIVLGLASGLVHLVRADQEDEDQQA